MQGCKYSGAEKNFNLFLEQLTVVFTKQAKTSEQKSGLIGLVRYAKKPDKGNILYVGLQKFNFIGIDDQLFVDQIRSNLDPLTNFEKDNINFAFIRNGSRLDMGPYLEFIY
jgi:hypothetical protein